MKWVILFLAGFVVSESYLICRDYQSVEPTVIHLFRNMTDGFEEFNFKNLNIASQFINESIAIFSRSSLGGEKNTTLGDVGSHLLKAVKNSGNIIGGIYIPFRSLISDAKFTIPENILRKSILLHRNDFLFSRILGNDFSVSSLGFFSRLTGFNFSACPDGQQPAENSPVSNDVIDELKHRFGQSQWCAQKIEKDQKLDPFRMSCLSVEMNDISKSEIVYDFKIPSLQEEWNITGDNYLLGRVPKYLFFAWLGLSLIATAPAIAAQPAFQYSVVACGGIGVFLLFIVYSVFKFTEVVATKNFAFMSSFITVFLAPILAFKAFSLPREASFVKTIVWAVDFIIQLWHFGFPSIGYGSPWIGKGLILVSAAASVFVAWWWRLFERTKPLDDMDDDEPTPAEKFLQLCVYSLGVWFIKQSTPNAEVSWLLLCGLLLWEPAKYLLHYNFLFAEGQGIDLGRQRSPQKKISRAECENIVSSTTERELTKLRDYIKANPGARDRINPQFNTNLRMNDFLDGDRGIPLDAVSPTKNSLRSRLTSIFALVVIVVALGLAWNQILKK